MKKIWNILWKIFGALLVVSFAAAIVIGLILHSAETTYVIIRGVLVVGLGILGLIGFLVVPLGMYIEYRLEGGGGTDDDFV